ncbi:MAG: GGDEF domain-containing protein [Woeseia sp.]|nr:GGDEF domain-containing protein [Woeseia sp.]
MIRETINFLRERLHDRPDQEHIQNGLRLLIVAAATVYFFSDRFAASAINPEYIWFARWAVVCACATSIALAVALLLNPDESVSRRVVGMVHDVSAISAAMYLGQAAAAGVAAIYLWVTLGNGFRYGNRYLYGCALLSFFAFGTIAVISEYWRSNATLSINILILLALIPPYVGALLSSLQRAKEQLKHQASIDVLTGLLNRAETEMSVERVLDRRHDGHSLLFCDLDLFKLVNDNAGHAAGDKLLADVARIIQECSGKRAIVGRLGGDEFCVFLPDCTMESARRIAENVRNSVSGYRLAWGREYYSVGISVGVAPTSAVQDMGSLFRLADAACYAAKNAGRNQVHVVDPRAGIADTQRIRRMFADTPLGATGAMQIQRSPDN